MLSIFTKCALKYFYSDDKISHLPFFNIIHISILQFSDISYLFVFFSTGERIFINVSGNCQNGNITIDDNIFQLEKTYIGLKSTHTFLLNNNTDHILQFNWLRYKDIDADHGMWEK